MAKRSRAVLKPDGDLSERADRSPRAILENARAPSAENARAPSAEEVQRLVDELQACRTELEVQGREAHKTQQQLERYRDRYVDLYDFAPLGYVTLDEDGYVQEINIAGVEMVGTDLASVIGYPFAEYVAEANKTAFFDHLRRCAQENKEVTSEVGLVRKDGREMAVQLHSIPVADARQDVTLCKTAMTDITERTQMEKALRRSQAFLQTVIDAIPDMTMVIGRDYGVVLANRAARKRAGDKEPGASCLACHHVIHRLEAPCGQEVGLCPLKQIIATKAPVTVVHTIRDDVAGERIVEISAAPIFDEAGEVVQIIESCRDITQRRLAEDQLRKEKDLSEATLSSLPGIFYAFDDQGKFLRWNKNFETVSGYSGEEIAGMHPLEFIAEDNKEFIAEKIQEVFVVGQAVAEATFRSKEGYDTPFFLRGCGAESMTRIACSGWG